MIMSEVYEHTDDEMVTFANIDLGYEFDKLNNMLFNGELTTVPLGLSSTKAKYGHVSYKYDRNTRLPIKINGLFITKFFKINYKKFKDILAHEMIHVKNLQDSMRNRTPIYKGDAHGYNFIKELNRINSMGLGFNVTDKEYDSHDVSDDVKGGKMYAAIMTLEGSRNGTFIFTMTPNAYSKRDDLYGLFSRLIKQGKYKRVEIEYFKVNSPYFLKFKKQQSFNSLTYSKSTPEDLDKLDEVGEEVDFVTIGDTSSKKSEPSVFNKPEPSVFSKPEPKPEPRPEPSVFSKPEPKPEPLKPEVSNEMKEINRKVMAIYKTISDQTVQEKLFDILQTTDAIKKQMKIDNYNQMLGPKYGFID